MHFSPIPQKFLGRPHTYIHIVYLLLQIINLIGWLLAAAIAILVLYGTYDSSGVPKLSNTASAIYNATARTGWGVAMAWVIVACATGNGGRCDIYHLFSNPKCVLR